MELTKAEEKTLIWLAGWEENTVDHLLSVIEKTARIRAYPKFDTTQRWAEVPSQELSDALIEAFKDKLID
ncbi:hypothetical protein FYJ45_27105 [Eisenbergiella tayi]|uniref:Uncharacterized protein n=1 Tax=Eisenbergiella porci TaxID=2652274 RepID=A0A6N7WM36_9FIRM|nr:hypothetical protein [Eisenbergiella porci]